LMSISSYMPVVANRGGDLGGGLGGIGHQSLGVGGEGPAEEVEEEGEGPRDGRRGAAPEVGGRGRRLEHPVQRLRLCVQRGGGEGTVRGGVHWRCGKRSGHPTEARRTSPKKYPNPCLKLVRRVSFRSELICGAANDVCSWISPEWF